MKVLIILNRQAKNPTRGKVGKISVKSKAKRGGMPCGGIGIPFEASLLIN